MFISRGALSLLAATTLFSIANAGAVYELADDYVGTDFLTAFVHQNITDPTDGRVYVSMLVQPHLH